MANDFDDALGFFNDYLKMTGLTDQGEQRRIVEGLHRKALFIRTALQQAQKIESGDLVPITKEAYEFLKGSGPLKGFWFGEKPYGNGRQYWWRKLLLPAAPDETKG